jgi:hypothetical protein
MPAEITISRRFDEKTGEELPGEIVMVEMGTVGRERLAKLIKKLMGGNENG